MSEKYFMTMSVVGWVDLFTRPELEHAIVDSLKYCQKEKGLVISAWCLMPSHLHLIGRATKPVGQVGQVTLCEIMRDFKKFTPVSAESPPRDSAAWTN